MMGAKWRVGDEKSIGVYNDSWIPGLPSGRVASSFSGLGRDIGVVELIHQVTGSWHVNLMENSFFPFEAQQILAIPLCASQQSNFFYWSLEKNGIYSVKSGYKILCDEARSEEALGSNRNGGSGLWSSIWKLKVPGKIKHFLWKASTDSLPTEANLLKKKS